MKKKGKRSKEKKVNSSLQELQSTISSLSLIEARKAVNIATESLKKLKEQQQEALEETMKIKTSILTSSTLLVSNLLLFLSFLFFSNKPSFLISNSLLSDLSISLFLLVLKERVKRRINMRIKSFGIKDMKMIQPMNGIFLLSN